MGAGKPAARITDRTMHGGMIVLGKMNVWVNYRPQSRITDPHLCPPGHWGGPIIPPCAFNVLVGSLPAARVTDKLVCACPAAIDIISSGEPTVLIGTDIESSDSGLGMMQRLALALLITKAGGSGDATDVALVAAQLVFLPAHILQRLRAQGATVVACRGSVTDYRADLRGVQPRGWPAGSTWDTVPGLQGNNQVVIATIGHGTPAGAHVPVTGEGHGSANLTLHETGHAVDYGGTGAPVGSTTPGFQAARTPDVGGLSSYETQAGSAGREETYAETFAGYQARTPGEAAAHPNINGYWASDPLRPP